MEPYNRDVADILREFGVDANSGMRKTDAEARIRQYGKNILPKGHVKSWLQILVGEFINPMVSILLIAAGLTLWLAYTGGDVSSEENEYVEFFVILLAVGVNVTIGFWQEYRSSRIFQTLQQLVTAHSRVIRDRRTIEIDASLIVPGDILPLRGGIRVPADARVISSEHLKVNEALLTGESGEVSKHSTIIEGKKAIGDRSNMIYLGTSIEKREGLAVVTGTGKNTELGQIALMTASVEEDATPLQERLSRLGKGLAIFISIVSAAIFAIGLYEDKPFVETFTLTVAVIVAAIPEGLPAALSVVLAVSAERILRKKGLVKKLIGAETLGSASVIVTDKTGTLTEGNMRVEGLSGVTNNNEALYALMFANEAIKEEGAGGKSVLRGELTDQAKLAYAENQSIAFDEAQKEYPRVRLIPFDQERKYILSFHREKDGNIRLYATGAPESLIERSEISADKKTPLLTAINEEASKGFRMIGLATRIIPKSEFSVTDEESFHAYAKQLSYVGTAALRDPIRSDVPESIQKTRRAGVRIIMATGDHPLTAIAIGRELGFSGASDCVVTGDELDAISDEALIDRVKHIEICARVSPRHKMRIIQALRANREVVVMTGDGVNDAPALKAADLGVALESGSDVTKETADLILLDNSFSIITEAIKQGRIAFDNIRKVTVFLLANSFTEIILVLAALILKIPTPVTAVMILWANLVEDGFPNFALAFEPGEKNVMERRPLRRDEPILDRESLSIIFIVGIVADLILLGVYLWLYEYRLDTYGLAYIQTIIFTMLATNSLVYVFSIKSLGSSILKTNVLDNRYLLFAVCTGFVVMGFAIYTRPLQTLLGTEALHPKAVLAVLGISLLQVVMIEAAKYMYGRRTLQAAV